MESGAKAFHHKGHLNKTAAEVLGMLATDEGLTLTKQWVVSVGLWTLRSYTALSVEVSFKILVELCWCFSSAARQKSFSFNGWPRIGQTSEVMLFPGTALKMAVQAWSTKTR